jgi:hypothetical protein
LPIHRDGEGNPETHDTRIYRIWRLVDGGCMDAIFTGSVLGLHEDGRLDTAVAMARRRRRKRAAIT